MNDYVQAHGLYVPLFEFLFSPDPLDPVIAERALNKVVMEEAGTMDRVQSVNNVQWRGEFSDIFPYNYNGAG